METLVRVKIIVYGEAWIIIPRKLRRFVIIMFTQGVSSRCAVVFTREYTKCTAGSTFCFVVVVLVVVLGKPLIKLASISADS
jgi:hypothetical protein